MSYSKRIIKKPAVQKTKTKKQSDVVQQFIQALITRE